MYYNVGEYHQRGRTKRCEMRLSERYVIDGTPVQDYYAAASVRTR